MIRMDDAQRMLTVLERARRVLCICHRGPDGDAVGALLGMALLIEHVFPTKTVQILCIDPVPKSFDYLPSVVRVSDSITPQEGDCVVFLDCAVPKQTGLSESHPYLFDGTYQTVNIDHHQDNPGFASVDIIVPDASSSCEIVVALADTLGWSIDSDIATCLLTGVYTDTGGLLHSNTTAHVYRTVARLLRAGARQQTIVRAVFRTAKLSTLKLWGRVLEKISLTEEGGAISAVTQADFRATGADYSELTGAIDYVNAVPGMRFSLILSERGGVVKGSLRTLRDDVDVAAMASKFSGGGHKKAAGFSLPGSLKPDVRWKVVEEQQPAPPTGPVPPAEEHRPFAS